HFNLCLECTADQSVGPFIINSTAHAAACSHYHLKPILIDIEKASSEARAAFLAHPADPVPQAGIGVFVCCAANVSINEVTHRPLNLTTVHCQNRVSGCAKVSPTVRLTGAPELHGLASSLHHPIDCHSRHDNRGTCLECIEYVTTALGIVKQCYTVNQGFAVASRLTTFCPPDNWPVLSSLSHYLASRHFTFQFASILT